MLHTSIFQIFTFLKAKGSKKTTSCTTKNQVAMAMQPKAKMKQFLFNNWLSHFIQALGSRGRILNQNQYSLIVHGHNSYVTLDVMLQAIEAGLDVLTSHPIYPIPSLATYYNHLMLECLPPTSEHSNDTDMHGSCVTMDVLPPNKY